jgi:hypothetical protein
MMISADLDWLGIANRLERFRNRHKGERAIVLCNGPSLNRLDFRRIRKEHIIGLNKIYLGFDRFKIYPRYYVAINHQVIKQAAASIKKLKCVNFVPPTEGLSSGLSETAYTHWIKADLQPLGFSEDICNGVHQGWTVTHVALQIAYFMGFQTVAIAGMDHRYYFDGHPNELRILDGPDPNHFSPDYFQDLAWNNPDLKSAEKAYRLARIHYEADGRQIFDCTIGGACDVFLKGKLEEVFL